ncbi:Imm21 family immunity protein [Plantactinospora soyae]|uniref:Immunity protein 21 of polymorphic toxin system n=1 Tax=Plantactinospora soyae TaxID=1544732 RepID=A0A927MDW8_9ACTN|nr:Imm21 family immunity protein [Plantactinospora soyae]MBE1491331.1 hypothetical protein [Plantactinospora soyae]
MMDEEYLHWIESAGGPLVVLAAPDLPDWTGSEGPDYDRACEVAGYLGLIEWGSAGHQRIGLVIGDEPLRTTFVPDLRCILQWHYAPSAHQLVDAARNSAKSGLVWEEGPTFELAERAVVFDAAATGTSLGDDEMILPSFGAGRYACATAEFAFEDAVAGRLHRLIRLD